jgi:hypothetical protein
VSWANASACAASGKKRSSGLPRASLRAALEQRRRRGVEHGDALVLVHADDGVQRGVDDGLQPLLAGVQLLVALLQRCALAAALALGQQRALVDHRAQKLQRPGRFAAPRCRRCAGRRDARGVADGNTTSVASLCPGAPAQRLARTRAASCGHKGHQRGQGPVALGGLETSGAPWIGLHHHVVFVHHHERQRHAGKQGLEALRALSATAWL